MGGSASAAKLEKLGVTTAAELAALEPDQARSLLTVTGGRVVYELRGISCLPLELLEPTRKEMAVTRSFRNPVTSWKEMRDAVASYATRAAEKMRRYEVAAVHLFIFMHTSAFRDGPVHSMGQRRGSQNRRMTPERLLLWLYGLPNACGETVSGTGKQAS